MKKILLFALCALVALGADATARKKKNTVQLEKTTLKAVPADSFSYAFGVMQAPSLMQYVGQQEGVNEQNLPSFIEGMTTQYTTAEEEEILARAAGIKIARMNNQRIIPNVCKQYGEGDSTYVDSGLYLKGLTEGLQKKASLPDSVAQQTVERQQKYCMDQMRIKNLNWLAENSVKDSIVVLPSGLQYKVLTKGTGAVPTDSVDVEVNYEGQLIDGTVFDSSYKRGKTATFKPTGVIKGWTEALTMMPVGSTWMLYIPYNLAYGEQGNRNIPPYATLIFKVELVSIKDKK